MFYYVDEVMKNMMCTFDEDINNCPNYDRTKKECTDSNTKCSFAKEEVTDKYMRKERWYEKYIK